MNPISLRVDDGLLCEVPSDETGPLSAPFETASTWAATITGDPKAMERSFWERPKPGRPGRFYIVPEHCVPGQAVEFGMNMRQTERTGQEDLTATEAFQEVRAGFRQRVPQPKRRWYGAVQEVRLDERRSGTILFVPMTDSKTALRLAGVYRAAPLDLPTLASFLVGVRAGEMATAAILCDWLEEQSDPRAEMLRTGIRELANSLFPEVGEA